MKEETLMKLKHLFSTTLSLALVACQVAAPVNTSLNVTPKTQAAQTLTLAKPALPQLETQATVTQTGNTEQVKVQIKLPKALQPNWLTVMNWLLSRSVSKARASAGQ
jgi:hypothetical protein